MPIQLERGLKRLQKGLVGLPFQALYSASKYAIEGYTEALRIEVKTFG